MDKYERERLLTEAVLTLDPIRVREAAEKTGHTVKDMSDTEIQMTAAEMIIFGIPDAPKDVLLRAISILSSGRFSFKYY